MYLSYNAMLNAQMLDAAVPVYPNPRLGFLLPRFWDKTFNNCHGSNIARIGRSIQQRNDGNNIRWLQQMPVGKRLLGAGTHSNREHMVLR